MSGFKGLIAAVFTPMKEDGSINRVQIEPIVEHLIEDGIDGIYVCGSTGEGASLTSEERRKVAEAYVDAIAGRIKVIVHIGHNSLLEARNLANNAKEIGADAIAAVPPSYFKPSSLNNLIGCLNEITIGISNLPFFYYHIPKLSGINLDMVEFLRKVEKKISNFVGIKYSDTNIYEFQACTEYKDGKYTILFGCDEMLLSALSASAVGAVGSSYNFTAPIYRKIIDAFNASKMKEACRYQSLSVKLCRLLYKYERTGIPAFKGVMKLLGLDCGPSRLPLVTMKPEKLAKMRQDLKELGFFE